MPEFVSVAVPADRVQEVYALLARRPSRLIAGPLVIEDGYSAGWSQSMLDRMFIESSNAMRRILYALAQRPACWVTTTEIAEAAGLTPRQVVASFGPFEKRVRGRYGMSQWPFETRGFVDEGISKYSMFSATGSRIIALMSEVGGQEARAT